MSHGFETLIAAHTAVTPDVRHGFHMRTDRYFVWKEDGRNDLMADGIHAEIAHTGTTDLYTRMEFDPWAREIEQSFDRHGICWYLNSVQYEEETGYWHYEWVWEV